MKLTTFILLMSLLQVSAATFGQKITLRKDNIKIGRVFLEIHKQTGYDVIVENSTFKESRINANFSSTPIDEVMNQLLQGQNYTYTIEDKSIVIIAKEPSFLDRLLDRIAAIDVHGVVTDMQGVPLAGATVKVKAKSKLVTTNSAGEFTITNVGESEILEISYIGYVTKEVTAAKEMGTIKMELLNSQLDQVQVIGYGTTTKRLSTGNVATVSEKTIDKQPVTNPLLSLSGRVAGLQITQINGLPGAPVTVQIRGRNSIAASNSPLYIVDGIPFTSTPIERFGAVNSVTGINGSPLNSISPSDIESITVLKDADATAIYGSRAANGVIMITTKKGTSNKPVLNVNVNTGFGEITRSPQLLNTSQYLQMRKDAFSNSGVTPSVSNAPDLLLWDKNENFNWQEWYMGNTVKQFDGNISINGGNQQTNFLISGNYHKEGTVLPSDSRFNRRNIHFGLNHASIDSRLKIGSNFYYSSSNNILHGTSSLLPQLIRMSPNYPIYDANGKFNWTAGKTNYLAAMTAYNKSLNQTVNANMNISYNLLEDLTLSANAGYSRLDNNTVVPNPSTSRDPATSPLGISNFANQSNNTLLFEPQINYVKRIDKSRFEFLLGGTIQNNTILGGQLNILNYPSDLLLESQNFGTAGSKSSTDIKYRYLSAFGRATYSLDGKYIFNANVRTDGSTRFGPGKRFGKFFSVGGAWIFSQESFIKDWLSFLSYGKLRGSYGTTGSDGISDNAYLSLYASTNNYGTSNAIVPAQIPNANYQWEVNKKSELAVDFGFFDDHLMVNSAWYRNRSGNQLVQYALPSTTGFVSYVANLPAVVENTGWEFELSSNIFDKKEFTWRASLNLTIPRNKLVKFPGLDKSSYANNFIIGKSLNIVQQYKFLGIDPANGLTKIQDANGDGIYTEQSFYNNQGGDLLISGNTDPRYFGGFSNVFGFKGFQLDVFFQYTNQKGYNLLRQGIGSFGSANNVSTDYLDYWKAPNDNVQIPKPFSNFNSSLDNYFASSATFSDASFLRLKNVSLSYEIPGEILSKVKLKALTIIVQGQNLWTKTNFIGLDPENSSATALAIPPLKMLTIGLKCSL